MSWIIAPKWSMTFKMCCVQLRLKTSRATWSEGDPWTRPCNPEKNWVRGPYFANFRIQEPGTCRVRNGVVFSWHGYFVWSGAKFDCEMIHEIYTNELMTHLQQPRTWNGPDTGLVRSVSGKSGINWIPPGQGKFHQDILQQQKTKIWQGGPGSFRVSVVRFSQNGAVKKHALLLIKILFFHYPTPVALQSLKHTEKWKWSNALWEDQNTFSRLEAAGIVVNAYAYGPHEVCFC